MVGNIDKRLRGREQSKHIHALPITAWPIADRLAWGAACRRGERLKRGGPAST